MINYLVNQPDEFEVEVANTLFITTDQNRKKEIIQEQATQDLLNLFADIDRQLNATLLCENETSENVEACKKDIESKKNKRKEEIRLEQLRVLKEAGVQVTQVKCDENQF